MIEATINYLSVGLAVVANMALGWLWYSPLLFGKRWMKEAGYTPKDEAKMKESGMKSMGIMFLISIVMAYILAHFVDYLGAIDLAGALQAAGWIWIGFVATIMLQPVLFERKPLVLYAINALFNLASLSVMAVVLVMLQ